MKTITRKWRKWLAIPLVIVLALSIALPLQLSQEPELVLASGVDATNVTLTGQDTTDDFTYVRFDIGWDYSWRDAENWDAIWVFVKYELSGGDWAHATLSTTSADHSITVDNGVAGTITVTSDGKGVLAHRTDPGTGNINWDGIELKWQYGTDGLVDADLVTVKVFAIEMVYIPQGSFDIGDGNGTSESVNAFHVTDNTKLTITTSAVQGINVDTNDYDDAQIEGTGIGIDGDGGLDTNNDLTYDNPSFPTGYNAFYMMKYELSQRQYAEFLNTLTSTQTTTRYPGQTTNRHYIEVQGGVYGTDADGDDNLNESDDGEWIAANYLTWMDGAAYADWAGLRPTTELELEKAGRGSVSAVYGEYAWGNINIASAAYTLTSPAEAGEVIDANYATGNVGNANYTTTEGLLNGPLRTGIFATATSTRAEAGASYYGVMELSGNLWERAVTIGNNTGRSFTGSHGDGSLSTNGNATNSDWPGYVTTEVTAATGSGYRGGAWSRSASELRLSDRTYAAWGNTALNDYDVVRLVRTAP